VTPTGDVGALALVLGLVFVATVAITGATLAGWAWRRMTRRADLLLEPALALVGLIGTAATLTFGLLLVWRVPAGTWGEGTSLADPLFVASLLGTVGGHLAVLAWARAVGAPVALTRATPRWMLVGVCAGGCALLLSAAWTETARMFGRPLADQELVSSLLDAEPGAARVVALLFVVAAAPVLEELVFRGYLQTTLSARFGAVVGVLVPGLLFGLFHLADPAVVPALAGVGILLGWVRHASGSVYPAMVGHLVNNVAAMALALA
jgi:membrane protease YdiL (CAAX protease family)